MPRGLDDGVVSALKRGLRRHPHGLWVRELARLVKVPKSTVSRYLYRALKDEVVVEWMGRNKVVRLRPRQGTGKKGLAGARGTQGKKAGRWRK